MKSMVVIALLVAVVATVTEAGSLHRVKRQLVPAEFANINIDNYLKNPRSVQFQLKCIVYDGPCDRIGKYLKVTIPELITGTCGSCSASDKQTAGKLVAHIQKNFPKEWNDAIKKFRGVDVKPEDAQKFEQLLGVKIDPEAAAAAGSTSAPDQVPAAAPTNEAAPAA